MKWIQNEEGRNVSKDRKKKYWRDKRNVDKKGR